MPEESSAIPASVATPVEAEIRAVPVELPAPALVTEPEIVSKPLAPVAAAEPEPALAPVPVRSEPIAMPAPIVDVEKALEQSGLVLIQTDPNKVKQAEPVAEPQFVPAAPRPRRAPPPGTGPLQIVETKK